jgi:hypothetical protein
MRERERAREREKQKWNQSTVKQTEADRENRTAGLPKDDTHTAHHVAAGGVQNSLGLARRPTVTQNDKDAHTDADEETARQHS